MSKRTKYTFYMEVGFILFSVAYLGWAVYTDTRWMVIVGGFLVGFHTTLATYWGRKMRHENRRATENSGSTGPGSSPNFGPRYISVGTARANVTFSSLGGASSIGATTSLETVAGDEPFKAWKVAYVPHEYPTADGKIRFRPVNTEFPRYGVDDVAQCARCTDGFTSKPVMIHLAKPPYEDCSCGFYGVISKADAISRMPYFYGWNSVPSGKIALLEVEFYGKVIVHTEGYRAGKQRVLSVSVITDNTELPVPPCETEWKWATYHEGVYDAR